MDFNIFNIIIIKHIVFIMSGKFKRFISKNNSLTYNIFANKYGNDYCKKVNNRKKNGVNVHILNKLFNSENGISYSGCVKCQNHQKRNG